MIFKGKIKRGKLDTARKDLEKYMKSLEGKEVVIEIKEVKKGRSLSQNRYYWGVVLKTIAEETGNEVDELHDTFKAMFLTDRTGKLPIVRSTTKLSIYGFVAYVDKIISYIGTEFGISIPSPDYYNYGEKNE